MCGYTRELGTPTTSQHNIFDSEENSSYLVLLTGFEPSSLDLEPDALPIEPRHKHVISGRAGGGGVGGGGGSETVNRNPQ